MHRLVLLPLLLSSSLSWAAHPVFQEKRGLVVIEAESTGSRLGSWKKKTDVAGYGGECHLEFTGNKPENGPPKSPLKYTFTISKPGKYTLTLRARKRLESKRADISNDCYVALKGDFEAGGEAPLKILKSDTKIFGGDPNGWGWANNLDANHKKFPPVYELKAGETYELIISGRSQNFNLDRLILFHESLERREVQRKNPPESETKKDSFPPPRVTRALENKDGKVIQAELVDKTGDTLVVLVKGRRYEIKISTLSDRDREFLETWEPGS